jgi:hypothetical protein
MIVLMTAYGLLVMEFGIGYIVIEILVLEADIGVDQREYPDS